MDWERGGGADRRAGGIPLGPSHLERWLVIERHPRKRLEIPRRRRPGRGLAAEILVQEAAQTVVRQCAGGERGRGAVRVEGLRLIAHATGQNHQREGQPCSPEQTRGELPVDHQFVGPAQTARRNRMGTVISNPGAHHLSPPAGGCQTSVRAGRCRRASLRAVDEDLEAAGNHRRPAAAFAGRRLGGGPELRGRQVDPVRLGIERHGARAAFGRQRLHHGQRVGRGLFGDGHGAVAAGGEGQAGAGIERVGIDALADRDRGEDLAGRAVQHRHELVAAAEEQAVIGQIDGHAGSLFAGGDGPARHDRVRLGVDDGDFALVLEIVVDAAGRRVDHGEFRAPVQGDGGDDRAGFGGDHGGRLAAAVERVEFLLAWIVEHAVGTLVGVHLGQRLQGLQVDNPSLALAAVAGEAAAEVGCQRHAMDARRVGDFADHRVPVEVDHDHLGGVADIEAPCAGIDRKVIPAAVAADFDLGDQVVGAVGAGERSQRCA